MDEKYCKALVFLCSTDKKFLQPFEPIILIEKISSELWTKTLIPQIITFSEKYCSEGK
jgi:hypothetical protein